MQPVNDRRRLLAAVLVAVAATAACGSDDTGDELADRQAEVADRGADVMPFDLDATVHHFQPVDDGLVQEVVAKDPGDSEQVALIRAHLDEEARRFRSGDFGDPAAIHGDDMPGLAELEDGAGSVHIEVEELPEGARLTYTAADPELVDALHRWGQAQVTDHGHHAEHGGAHEQGSAAGLLQAR